MHASKFRFNYMRGFARCVFLALACLLSLPAGAQTFPSYLFAPDAESSEVTFKARSLLVKGEFAKLDLMADDLRRRKARFPDGQWKLPAFYDGMQPAQSSEPEDTWTAYETLLKRWREASGRTSPTPHVALARFYIERAWRDRGHGYIGTVTPAGGLGFRDNLRLARDVLAASGNLGKQCPHSYVATLSVALGLNWPESEYEAVFKEAVAREPGYYDFYFYKTNYLLPKWHGSREKIKQFAEASAASTLKAEGYTLYARIFWAAAEQLNENLFETGLADWPKMKAGFETMNLRYPHSVRNNNALARFACMAGDKETTATALRAVGGVYIAAAWPSMKEVERCKQWALEAAENATPAEAAREGS